MVGKRSGVSQGSSPVLFGDGAPLPSQTKKKQKTKNPAFSRGCLSAWGNFQAELPTQFRLPPPGTCGAV